jgi:hypothetical protein
VRATLLRHTDSPHGVFGYLTLYDDAAQRVARFVTAEDDWLNNLPRVSCIPAGTYRCHRVVSPKFGPTYQVMAVPGRDHILFHAGNVEENTEGCILLGEAFGALASSDEDAAGTPVITKWAVVRSKEAFTRFKGFLDTVPLEIRWSLPGEWRK